MALNMATKTKAMLVNKCQCVRFGTQSHKTTKDLHVSIARCPSRVGAHAAVRVGVVRAASVADVEPFEVEYEKQDYAVVELGGSQTIVEEGGTYDTDRIDAEPGSIIKLNRVLLVKHQDSGKLHLGQPYVENATVEAEVVNHKKGKKVIVFKMQPKKHTRSKRGHRQLETTIKVTKISTV